MHVHVYVRSANFIFSRSAAVATVPLGRTRVLPASVSVVAAVTGGKGGEANYGRRGEHGRSLITGRRVKQCYQRARDYNAAGNSL